MIIVKLRGGLGNQLFQFSAGKNLALLKNTELMLDVSDLKKGNRSFLLPEFCTDFKIASHSDILKVFIRNYRHANNLLKYFFDKYNYYYKIPIFKEKSLAYDKNFFNCPDDVYMIGYWQCERYFKDIVDILKSEISFKKKMDKQNEEFQKEIENTESICVHLRNGDYFFNSTVRKNIGVCPVEYYYKAIDNIIREVDNPHFYIFSDNIEWAKEHLKIMHAHTYISNNSNKSYVDLYLMSRCKHFIIANSSFSWWGAWLSGTKNKIVYAPTPWCKNPVYNPVDIHPHSWREILVNLI